MIQSKFSLSESHIKFIEKYKHYGFKDKSELVRTALDCLSAEIVKQRLRESASLYAEVYEEDDETQKWTDAVLSEWPK